MVVLGPDSRGRLARKSLRSNGLTDRAFCRVRSEIRKKCRALKAGGPSGAKELRLGPASALPESGSVYGRRTL